MLKQNREKYYKEFQERLKKEFDLERIYIRLFSDFISKPEKYAGTFRLSGIKNRISEMIERSNELKFTNFAIKEVYRVIEENGYSNITENENGTIRIYHKESNNEIILLDVRVRLDSGTSKKKEYTLRMIELEKNMKNNYPNKKIRVVRGVLDGYQFVNSGLIEEVGESSEMYKYLLGYDLFKELGIEEHWDQLFYNFKRQKEETISKHNKLVDFDNDPFILSILEKMPGRPFNRLCLENPGGKNDFRFNLLKEIKQELFPTGHNIEKAKISREQLRKNGVYRKKRKQ